MKVLIRLCPNRLVSLPIGIEGLTQDIKSAVGSSCPISPGVVYKMFSKIMQQHSKLALITEVHRGSQLVAVPCSSRQLKLQLDLGKPRGGHTVSSDSCIPGGDIPVFTSDVLSQSRQLSPQRHFTPHPPLLTPFPKESHSSGRYGNSLPSCEYTSRTNVYICFIHNYEYK